MSELKATTAQEIVQNEKDCDYMDELFGGVKMPPTQVYLKSEADKVIAEKDKEIAELKKQKAIQKIVITEQIDEMELKKFEEEWSKIASSYPMMPYMSETDKKFMHQKYKRCEAMAEWCNSEMARETFACFRTRNTKEVWREEHKYWAKWRKIWFELYKKLKPNNSTAQ